ncbi:hypothetical protein GH714_016637 [Hevea brasiliensis]|uniref:Uncharacterized protein n=1 Tax=Hevea brasiliensis TaxID=3981 RepID=A0A6A6MX93_HEVBR|nr:hypothetical protein GH714_016637 [Hevea brasiliensis]
MAQQNDTVSSSSNQSSSSTTTQSSPLDPLNKQPQVPPFSGFPAYGDFQMYPIVYPALVPGLTHLQNQEQMNRGAGIYAVPVPPFMGPIAGLPSSTLIPLTYNIPTRSGPDTGAANDQGQGGQQPQQQQAAPQRQVVVRRFQIAFQLDLLLILKLAAVIFCSTKMDQEQDLLCLCSLLHLSICKYQTGALTPLVQWLSQSMRRAAQPPRPPRPVARAENAAVAARQNENVGLAEGQAGADNENRPAEDGNQAVENENVAEPGGGDGGNHWWGIVKEIQMIVFGFITSLLPGFHNVD